MPGWREDRVGSALRGENPMVMARMWSDFAVIGDAVKAACRPHGLRRVDYEVRSAPERAYDDARHGALRAAISEALTARMDRAYEP